MCRWMDDQALHYIVRGCHCFWTAIAVIPDLVRTTSFVTCVFSLYFNLIHMTNYLFILNF